MKLRIAIGLGVAAISLPAVALAVSTSKYRGTMDRGGVVRLKLEKDGSERRMLRFIARHQKADCVEGTIPVYGGFSEGTTRGIPVAEDGSFEAHLKGSGTSAGDTIDLEGKLEGKRKASGTFAEHLEDARSDGEDYTDCNTGELEWKAKRE